MTIEQFESLSLFIGVGSLIAYMFFIMFKLAQESQAGKFGTFVIIGCLGLGIFGFLAKEVITVVMQV